MACGSDISSSLDAFFLLVMGSLVFFMQAGFAYVEAGSVSARNVTNILFKNVMDTVVGAISYFAVGYAFSYGVGSVNNKFIGNKGFFLNDISDCELKDFFYQFTFAATATTIISGAVAGRSSFIAYVTYSIFVTGFIYPVIVYWTWSGNAWLAEGDGNVGYVDFAGSGIVHVTGGMAALIGAWLIGPRSARAEDPEFKPLPPHSTPLITLGGFILIFGFFGFNGGSVLAIADSDGSLGASAALAVVNTVLSAAGGGLAALTLSSIRSKELSLTVTINGAIAGMVAICAPAATVRPWAGLVIGMIGGIAMVGWSKLLQRLKIDDPIDAVAVHLGGGIWGVLSQPLFASETGILYTGSKDAFTGFGWNIAGVLTIIVWTGGMCLILFGTLKKFGSLRVSDEDEKRGLDQTHHGGLAYHLTVKHGKRRDSARHGNDISTTANDDKGSAHQEVAIPTGTATLTNRRSASTISGSHMATTTI